MKLQSYKMKQAIKRVNRKYSLIDDEIELWTFGQESIESNIHNAKYYDFAEIQIPYIKRNILVNFDGQIY